MTPACIVPTVPKLGRLSWKTWPLARPSESKPLGVGVRLAPCLQSPSSPEVMDNTFSNEKRRLCYRKWLMLFPLKLQRNNRQNALAAEPAKGKTGKKLYFHRTVKLKQPHTNRAKKEAACPTTQRRCRDAFLRQITAHKIWQRKPTPQSPACLQAPPVSRWRITATSSQSGKRGQFAQTIQTRWGSRSLLTTQKPFRSKKRT